MSTVSKSPLATPHLCHLFLCDWSLLRGPAMQMYTTVLGQANNPFDEGRQPSFSGFGMPVSTPSVWLEAPLTFPPRLQSCVAVWANRRPRGSALRRPGRAGSSCSCPAYHPHHIGATSQKAISIAMGTDSLECESRGHTPACLRSV